MKVIIHHTTARYVLYNDKDYPTMQEIDLPFSEAVRMGRVFDVRPTEIYEPLPYIKSDKINFIADIDSESGWGNASLGLLRNTKLDVSIIGKIHSSVSDAKVFMQGHKAIDPTALAIWHEQPKASWDTSFFKKNIAIVPFETTLIPNSWVARINKFDALFTICEQNIKMFRDSGVTIPIEKILWGVDSKIHYPVERAPNRPFTFGTMGSLSTRKGTDILVRAFERAFPLGTENVRLICKTSNFHYMFMSKDKRIVVHMMPWTHAEIMRDFYQQVDCFVFPTRGEGFGMPALEAMATGIPTIATNWSGICEFLNDDVGYLLDYKMVSADDFTKNIYKEECGDWAEPNEDQLVDIMKHCYENQDEVKEKGKKAQQYVMDKWQWKDVIHLFDYAVKKYS